jgi:hypothetical protein
MNSNIGILKNNIKQIQNVSDEIKEIKIRHCDLN